MKVLKMLGLAAIAAMAVMAFVGASTAPADELCTDEACTTTITSVHASLKAGTSLKVLTTEGTTLDTCTTGTLAFTITNQGAGVDPITATLNSLTWGTASTPCTFTTDTIKNGTLTATNAGGSSGAMTGVGNEVHS